MGRLFRYALGALVLTGAACGESSYRFVANGAEKTYMKVPREWATTEFETERLDRIDPTIPEDVELIWSVAIDASGQASVDRVDELTDFEAEPLEVPVGSVSVYQVQGNYLQNLSLASARSIPLGIDPLAVPDDVKDLVELIAFQPLAPNDGLQGGRVIFNLRPSDIAGWRTYDVVTAFDQTRNRLYVLKVGCSAECFEDNQVQISDVVTSWKVDR